jgi:hypothetical protein
MSDTDRTFKKTSGKKTSGIITQRPWSTTSVNASGEAAEQAPTLEKQVRSAHSAPAHTGDAAGPEFSARLGPDLDPDNLDGPGTEAPWRRPGAQDHSQATGDAKDSQYGAAPVRGARYRDGSGGTYGQGGDNRAAASPTPKSKP